MVKKICSKFLVWGPYLVIIFYLFFDVIPSPLNRVRLSELDEYVKENNEYLSGVAQQFFQVQDENCTVMLYRCRNEIPKGIDVNKLYNDLWVDKIYVLKNHLDDGDQVNIVLREHDGNYICVLNYYSDNSLLDCYSNPIDGKSYKYDGQQFGERFKYKTWKICDYWFVTEEDRW